MCAVDTLMKNVNETHSDKAKRELDEIILAYRDKYRVERENVRLYIRDIKREFSTLSFP